MMVLPVLAVGILMKMAAVLFVLVSVVLILVILVQKGRGGGLSGAFGGGAGGGLMGTKTGDFLTWVTIILVGVFLLLAILLAKFYRPPEDYSIGTAGPATVETEEGAPAVTVESGAESAPTDAMETPTVETAQPEAQPVEAPPVETTDTQESTEGQTGQPVDANAGTD
jgi:preprotein translocase subunit SecG